MSLRDQRDECSREQGQSVVAAGELGGQQEREYNTHRSKRHVGEPHQDQATVRGTRCVADPDERGHRDVVEGWMVRHPHPAVSDVVGRRSLCLPLTGLDRHLRERTDLRQPERCDLVGVADMRCLVRRPERCLLQRMQ